MRLTSLELAVLNGFDFESITKEQACRRTIFTQSVIDEKLPIFLERGLLFESQPGKYCLTHAGRAVLQDQFVP